MTQNSQSAAASFSPLLCVDRTDETADTTTFEFRKLDSTPFEFHAGQFITFQVDVADEQLHRAYSISSSPSKPETVSVTIKRVEGGRVSNFLIDNLQPGHALPAMPPAGEFTLEHCRASTQLVLLSAGSGITPCISIARWLLDTEQPVDIRFVYSARSTADVIMAAELNQLAEKHDNFHLSLVLDQLDSDQAYQGPLDKALFDRLLPDLNGRTIFTCGPQGYMDAVEALAKGREFHMELFHKESFDPAEPESEVDEGAAEYQLTAAQFGKTAQVREGETLLSVLEAAGVPVIGACRSGVCGSCKCKVASGEVESSSQSTLTEDDIAAGYVLACSSKVKSDLAIEL